MGLLLSFFDASSGALRFLGCAFSTNVHSCLWNSQRTHLRFSCSTHLDLRRLQPSQGRSLLGLAGGVVLWTCFKAGRFSLPSAVVCCLGEDQAAMGRGEGRGAMGAMAIAVAMSARVAEGFDVVC